MKKFLLLIIISSIPSWVFSQISHAMHFSSSDLSIESIVAADNNTYSEIRVADFNYKSEPGMPALPVKQIKLVIPEGTTVDNISIANSSSENYQLNHLVYPNQFPETGYLGDEFAPPDATVYTSQNAWPAEKVKLISQDYFDGNINLITLEIRPFEYHPTTGVMHFFTEMTLDITLSSNYPMGISNIHRLEKNQIIYDDILYQTVANPDDIGRHAGPKTMIDEIISSGPLPSYEYVIVAPSYFEEAFDDFIDWKTKKGIDIGVVHIEDILNTYDGDELFPGYEIYDDAGKLRHYLFDAYLDGTTWALLAGDASEIPIRYGGYPTNAVSTDLYFTNFTGNWNVNYDTIYGNPDDDDPHLTPNIFVGRLLCSSPNDILNWVHKVLIYEKNPGQGDRAYLTEALHLQADQMQKGDWADDIATYLPMYNHTVMEEYPSYYDTVPTFPKGADVVAELNTNNYGLMSWLTHGGTGHQNSGIMVLSSGMAGSPYYKLDAEEMYDFYGAVHEDGDGLDNLTNYDHPFIIYSTACIVTPFDRTKGIGNDTARNCGESFTVNNLAGGVAFLGNTFNGSNNSIGIYREFAKAMTETQYAAHLGKLHWWAKYTYGKINAFAYSFNLIGCPEMQMWTAAPRDLIVKLDPGYVFINIPNDIAVNISNLLTGERAMVALYKEGEIFMQQEAYGDQNQQAQVVFENIITQTYDEIYVTVTALNHIPFHDHLPVATDCQYNPQPLTIDEDVSWEMNKFVNQTIEIEPGAELTVKSTVFLVPGTNIKVKQGGHLIVDGGRITNACGQYWHGIQVWGNKHASQLELPGQLNPQGKLTLKNGAVIENAFNAVTLWKPNDWNTTGGIVQAENATFMNNKRSVEFLSYQNFNPIDTTVLFGNVSYFRSCTFEVNDDYMIGSDFDSHITMYNVDGIQLRANNFRNEMTEAAGRGNGIFTIDANYKVEPRCSQPVVPCPEPYIERNVFSNLDAGIYATNSRSSKTIFVDQATFSGNGYGVVLNAVNNATVIRSMFHIDTFGKPGFACSGTFGVGIDITNSNGYIIEENHFSSRSDPSAYDLIGIRVYNETEFNLHPNDIYNNSFNALNRANLAEGKNHLDNEQLGLLYQCNTNTENHYDFYFVDHGVAGHQGSGSRAAGNSFTQIPNPLGPPHHINNMAINHVDYYHTSDALEIPTLISSNVTPHMVSFAHDCASSFGGGGGGQIDTRGLTAEQQQYFEQELSESQNTYNNVSMLYASLLDGGNTEALQADIDMAWPEDMWALRAELLGFSPHLSKDVLVSASDRTDVLPESIIFEVLSANPDELKKQELMEHLENKDNPLPDYMIEILESLTGNVTYKTILQGQMAYHGSKEARAAGILLRDMLNDSIRDEAAIHGFMAARQNLPMDMQMVDAYLESGQAADALALAGMLPQLYNLTEDALAEHGRYMELKQLQAGLHNQQRNIFQLTETEKVQLEGLVAESTGLAGMQARNILSFVYGYDYCDCPVEVEAGLKAKPTTTPPLHKLHEPQIEARPNPASTWVGFIYTIPETSSNALLEIRDTGGKLVYQASLDNMRGQYIWDTRNIAPGLYHYTLSTSNGLKSGKVTIVK